MEEHCAACCFCIRLLNHFFQISATSTPLWIKLIPLLGVETTTYSLAGAVLKNVGVIASMKSYIWACIRFLALEFLPASAAVTMRISAVLKNEFTNHVKTLKRSEQSFCFMSH